MSIDERPNTSENTKKKLRQPGKDCLELVIYTQ